MTSHFFLCAALLPRPRSQLSHSDFAQNVRPDTDKAPCNELERLGKHPGTVTHTLTHSRKQTFAHTLSFMSQSLAPSHYSVLVKEAQKHKTNNSHSPAACCSAFALRLPFILIMEERKVPAQDCLWHLYHLVFLKVPTNLSDKIHEGVTFKEEEEERSCLNNESVRGMNHSPGISVWVFGKFSSGWVRR